MALKEPLYYQRLSSTKEITVEEKNELETYFEKIQLCNSKEGDMQNFGLTPEIVASVSAYRALVMQERIKDALATLDNSN